MGREGGGRGGGEQREEALWALAWGSLSSVCGGEEPPATSPLCGKEHKSNPHGFTPFYILYFLSCHLWGSPLPTPMCPWPWIITATPFPLLLLGLVPPDLKVP